jgi:hypothetical protein
MGLSGLGLRGPGALDGVNNVLIRTTPIHELVVVGRGGGLGGLGQRDGGGLGLEADYFVPWWWSFRLGGSRSRRGGGSWCRDRSRFGAAFAWGSSAATESTGLAWWRTIIRPRMSVGAVGDGEATLLSDGAVHDGVAGRSTDRALVQF